MPQDKLIVMKRENQKVRELENRKELDPSGRRDSMRLLTFEAIEMMFREMGLGTQEERNRFLAMDEPVAPQKEDGQQLFIRIEDATIQIAQTVVVQSPIGGEVASQ